MTDIHMNTSEPTNLALIGAHELGKIGEQAAVRWLEARSCTILDRNWHSRFGELDIVARTFHGTILFVEVKTRRNTRFGSPQEAVTTTKQVKIRRAATQWLMEHRGVHHIGVRFDVISIMAHPDHLDILHIPEAF